MSENNCETCRILKEEHKIQSRAIRIDLHVTSSLLDNASAYVNTLENRIDQDKSKLEAQREALRACRQCIQDVLEGIVFKDLGIVRAQPYKSLKNDALRLVNRVLDDGEELSELETQYLQWKDEWTASFIEMRAARDLLQMQERAMFMELARTTVELSELRRATSWIPVEIASPEVGQYVLFRFADGSTNVGARYSRADEWNFRNEPENRIVAWMPIPEYKNSEVNDGA